MMKLKNERYAFYAAVLLQTFAYEGSLKKVTFYGDDRNLVNELLNGNLDEMYFNYMIRETIAILDTCYQEEVNDNVKAHGIRYSGAFYCWPPDWLVEDMGKFEDEQWIPKRYLEENRVYYS